MFRTVSSALQSQLRRRALAGVASSSASAASASASATSSSLSATTAGPVSLAGCKPLVAYKSTLAKLEYDVNDHEATATSSSLVHDDAVPLSSTTSSDKPPSLSSLSSSDDKQLQAPREPTATSYSSFDRTKSGTPSPWAVFDAWGAGADENVMDITDPLSNDERRMLTSESVKIPLSESDRAELPPETDILHAYDHLLRGKSSVHFGYPYNLMFDFTELTQFLKYSINNLGDPFVPSNYGVHSRQFECSVIDFFASLWKMPPSEYWGYGTCYTTY